MTRKKKEPTEKKNAALFDFLNAIYNDQTSEFFDSLSDAEKRSYRNTKYMINRFISMNPHYLEVINIIQKYSQIPERPHYLFLANMLPKRKQFYKYIKASKEGKYEEWLIELVAKHYQVSKSEATQYVEIYYSGHTDSLRELCERYAVDSKLIKKANL